MYTLLGTATFVGKCLCTRLCIFFLQNLILCFCPFPKEKNQLHFCHFIFSNIILLFFRNRKIVQFAVMSKSLTYKNSSWFFFFSIYLLGSPHAVMSTWASYFSPELSSVSLTVHRCFTQKWVVENFLYYCLSNLQNQTKFNWIQSVYLFDKKLFSYTLLFFLQYVWEFPGKY